MRIINVVLVFVSSLFALAAPGEYFPRGVALFGCRRRRRHQDAGTADFACFAIDELFNRDCIWSYVI